MHWGNPQGTGNLEPVTAQHTTPLSHSRSNQIINSEYVMEKRGKTFGNKQFRRFAVRQAKLYQISTHTTSIEAKELPLPARISTELRQQTGKLWAQDCKGFGARLCLEFNQRSPVLVYFNSVQQSQEMKAYILSLVFKQTGLNLGKYSQPYKEVIINEVVSKTKQMATHQQQKPQTARTQSPKEKAIVALMGLFELVSPVYTLVEQWATKTQSKIFRQTAKGLRIKIDDIKVPFQLKLNNPTVKLWIANESRQLPPVVKDEDQKDMAVFLPSNNGLTEIPACSLESELQLEISQGNKKWKSQRMKLMDLFRFGRRVIRIPLASTQPYPTALIEFSLDTQLQELLFPEIDALEMTPNNYLVIQQVIGCVYSDNSSDNHKAHKDCLSTHMVRESEEIQFFRLKRYIQMLQIEAMIDKCYANEPLFERLGTKQRGTVIYNYYVNSTRKIRYYDVENLLLEHGQFHRRRFFNALKMFDNAFRINFTSKLYYLVDKILSLAETAPASYWSSDLFKDNYIGRESIAFFIVVILIFDIAPNYCLVGNRGVATNSLLMHYTTKVHLESLYLKLNLLEINIETVFGVYSASLLAELVQGEAFYRVLDALIVETKSKKYEYEYNLTMVGLFLSLLQRMQQYQSVFESPENFMFGLRLLGSNVVDQCQFCYEGDLFIQKMRKVILDPVFLAISQQIKQIPRSDPEDASSAMIEFFTSFPENQQKTDGAYRQMHFCVNKIQIKCECPKITIYLFQKKVLLFQQDLVNTSVRQMNFNFGIKLDSLADVVLALYQDQKLYTQFCVINPRKIASNYMFQLCLPLQKKKGLLLDESPSYICFQVIIKDESQSQIIQDKVPQKYGNFFLQTDKYKTQISDITKFSSLFRMSPNNYNTLYSNLGWYNNHYIYPAEKLLSIHKLEKNDIQELTTEQLSYYYKMNKYSRCAFGRAVVFSRDRSLFSQVSKNGIQFVTTFKSDLEKSKSQTISNQLACYTLENVKTSNPTYLQFFLDAMDLPLIDYLSYNPSQYDVLPSISFSLSLGDSKASVMFASGVGDNFLEFTEAQSQQIENSITFRKLKIKSKYVFVFPSICTCLDNFLYLLKLNIFSQVIRAEPSDNKVLTKWPSHIVIKANQLTSPLDNLPLHRFFILMYQTKYNIVMEFADQGKARFKLANAVAFLNHYGQWRKVQVLCEITSLYKYYLVEEFLSRKKLIIKQAQLIDYGQPPSIKIVCEEAELCDLNSQLYKKIQKLF